MGMTGDIPMARAEKYCIRDEHPDTWGEIQHFSDSFPGTEFWSVSGLVVLSSTYRTFGWEVYRLPGGR